jgi:hypothetical protein
MRRRSTQNRTPFELQPRRQQKVAYIDVKNRIRRAASVLGGKFVTHDYMNGKNGWLDVCFLGRKAPVFYNLTIDTTTYAYKEAVWHRSWELSHELAPDREPFLGRAVKNPKTGMYEVPPREPLRYPELDGMTRFEWVESQQRLIADSGEIQVYEEWTLHRDYACGIGLHATIDVPYLTIETVNGFVDRFLALESDYRDPVPRSYRHDEIAHWGLETNAVIEPWDWAAAEEQARLGAPPATDPDRLGRPLRAEAE